MRGNMNDILWKIWFIASVHPVTDDNGKVLTARQKVVVADEKFEQIVELVDKLILQPNNKTKAAIRAVRRGDVTVVSNAKELFKSLEKDMGKSKDRPAKEPKKPKKVKKNGKK